MAFSVMAQRTKGKGSEVHVDRFLKAMKGAHSDRGLDKEECFQALSRGQGTARVTVDVLRRGIEIWGLKLLEKDVAEIVTQVKPDWKDGDLIIYPEFEDIFKILEFLEAMKKETDSGDEGLETAFEVLDEGAPVTVAVLRLGMENRGVKLPDTVVADIIAQVKPDWKNGEEITCQHFKDIFNHAVRISKFLEALKKKTDPIGKKLEEAFQALSEDGSNAPVTLAVLCLGMENRRVKLPDTVVANIVIQVKPEWKNGEQITAQQFKDIFECAIWIFGFLEALGKKDGLKAAFDVLTKDERTAAVTPEGAFKVRTKDGRIAVVTPDVLRLAMENLGVKPLDVEDIKEIVVQVKRGREDEELRFEGFKDIVEKLKALTVVSQLEKIREAVAREEVAGIVLHGKPGVGKTWMAKKVADRAVRQKTFNFAIWIYPQRIYNRGFTLQESIAHQLFLMLAYHKSVAEEARHGDKPDDEVTPEQKKLEKLEQMIRDAVKDKKLMLIFDDLENVEENVGQHEYSKKFPLSKVNRILHLEPENDPWRPKWRFEVLITTSSKLTLHEGIEVMPWTWGEVRAVISSRLGDDPNPEKKQLVDFFIGKTRKLPAEILIIAKTMSYICKGDSGLKKMKSIWEEIKGETDSQKVIQKLITMYDPIPKSILIDCYSSMTSPKHFLNKSERGTANFNELISYWIMEEHLGQFDCLQDAYDKGYRVVMDLLDCGLLRKLENSYVMSCGWKFEFDICDYYKYFGKVLLGMGNTFDSKLGKIALADGIMRTVAGRQEEEKLLAGEKLPAREKLQTLMLDGNHFELPGKDLFKLSVTELAKEGFLEPQLEILAVFNPTVKPFPLPVYKLKNLRLLVLRGCAYLKKFEEIFDLEDIFVPLPGGDRRLKRTASSPSRVPSLLPPVPDSKLLGNLTVLEISGDSPVCSLPEFFFKNMPELRSINLSSLSFKSLPDSFYKLEKVEYLILRGCTNLEILRSLENFTKLQLLDVSNSTKLRRFEEKNFRANAQLQFINFSNTFIDRIPLIRSLRNLISLTLCDCKDLRGIRKLNGLRTLRVLNISGAKMVEELLDPIIDNLESIEVFDVSRTAIKRLPVRIGNPRFFHMSGCLRVTELLPIDSLSRVEVFDVSGCCNLNEIKYDFLKNMNFLRKLDLSRTGIKVLPSLPSPRSLRHLLLSDCQSLENLDSLSYMEELEELYLSGCKALANIKDGSFDKMNQIHTLSLSELPLLDRLPSLAKLQKLEELCVTDCPKLTLLLGIEELSALKILNHSGTTLESVPSLNPDCLVTGPIAPSLKNFDQHQLLKDLGASPQQHGQRCVNDQDDDGAEKADHLEGDWNLCNWKISSWRGQENDSQKTLGSPGAHFLKLLKMHPQLLKERFGNFHFLLVSTDGRNKLPDKSSYKDELKLRVFLFRQVSTTGMLQRCLEIRGFLKSPKVVQRLLEEAESVVLIDNPFLKCLFDLGPGGVKLQAMKACWIERCNEMKYLIQSERPEGGDKTGDQGSVFADSLQNLQILWFSHVMRLHKISSGEIPGFSFKSVESIYLEFCPELSSICSSFQQFGALKSLHIRNCEKLKILFEDKSAELVNLTELHLWGLPTLVEINLKAPSLLKLRVGDCCLLEHVPLPIQGGGHANLEILQIKSCENLKMICEGLPKLLKLELWALPKLKAVPRSITTLETLRVGECHSLENLVELPGKLKVLEVKSCDKLKTIFLRDLDPTEKLDVEMKLLCLPELKSIGASRSPSIKEEGCMIWGCPELQLQETQGGTSLHVSETNDTQVQ